MVGSPTLRFSVDGVVGLGQAEAQQRLQGEGPNELPSQRGRGVLRIALDIATEPMFLLLLSAGALYFATGKPGDAMMLMGFVVVVMAITIVQERRTENALEALRDLSSPKALVIRDAVTQRIPGREVVRGDMMVVAEGERIPADALVRRASMLEVDESLLTGESAPVAKCPSAAAKTLDPPGGEQHPSVYSGTLVTAGQALCEVMRTGVQTELGRIGTSLQQLQTEATPLQRETRQVVRRLALLGLGCCVLVVVAYALARGGSAAVWKDGLLAGIAMAMAILPEEFPVVLTVFLALGAWRIASRQVLTRRMPAIEALGSATVLCVDKTGTLTQNRMVLRWVGAGGVTLAPGACDGHDGCRSTLATAVLASRPAAFDPMERALHDAASAGVDAARRLVHEYPLTADLLAVTHIWEGAEGGRIAAAKGAPEAIALLCQLSPTERARLVAEVAVLAEQGLRVLAVARAESVPEPLPDTPLALPLRLLGIVGFEDPLRAEVPAAVAECRAAGI
ncbi:MAG: cation-transporting P-type ATPase, partial [Proteobacteria bacterium]|nr:cation-transporting P-type ATPase [Pseudomonadota bacterium]